MTPLEPPANHSRAWFECAISEFQSAHLEQVIGQLATASEFAVTPEQRYAWEEEFSFLRKQLNGLDGVICLEFNIPRMGRRIDTVLIILGLVFVIEFKVGANIFTKNDLSQVWDYALDLKYFHKASHSAAIIPILVATASKDITLPPLVVDEDGVYHPMGVSPRSFRQVIDNALADVGGVAFDARNWSRAPYYPTPTIVEAARALYSRHSVEEIARSDAGAKNLAVTSRRVEHLADQAKANRRKTICFVTGVPGAGKTLVGLNVATRNRSHERPTHAVFLSGNGPLVQVLTEALTRDEVKRRKAQGEKVRKGRVHESVKAFIQNVHHFRDEGIASDGPPADHVVIFDEAQRAWNARMTAHFMQRKKKRPGFTMSEPELLLSYMDRHEDWALVACLVGGGQEINTGEAGIGAWIDAVAARFPNWDMYISTRLTDSEYSVGGSIERIRSRENTFFDDDLHLAVSMRSFRAESVSALVKAVLDGEEDAARRLLQSLKNRYPIVLTRDLAMAKQWIRNKSRGSERFGLLASSRAMRLKPHAIDVRVNVDPVKWFLNGCGDVRSSFFLEDAATEFQVQGLELDWACVTWDGDLRRSENGWSFHDFRGDKWQRVKNSDNQSYLRNAYRVLLTRARQGMAIFVPPGDPSDLTRPPEYYDGTFAYLADLGIQVL